jgi:hypothetical protein
MIFYLATERFSTTMRYFLDYRREALRGVIKVLSYEELFFEGAGPAGHYIFTDFDRLSRYELESAAAFASALHEAVPEARILNHPLKVLERYALLAELHRAGINDFSATRIESGERPSQYPVFIRAEDGCGGPETDLLHDEKAFDAAVDEMERRGLPSRGRIAVRFANERAPDGYFHKYGAFNIGGRILPYDLLFGESWVVKIRPPNHPWLTGRDVDYANSAEGIAKELSFVRDNPHQEILRRAFALARIDYGRADYGIVNGRPQIYEINTNPRLPRAPSPDKRSERRDLFMAAAIDAIKAIETPIRYRGRVSFKQARPRAHDLHLPRRRLPISLLRRSRDLLSRRQPLGKLTT